MLLSCDIVLVACRYILCVHCLCGEYGKIYFVVVMDMKKVVKFTLIVFIYIVLFMITNAIMPYSQSFKEANANTDVITIIFTFISMSYNCFVICFIAANSNWRHI